MTAPPGDPDAELAESFRQLMTTLRFDGSAPRPQDERQRLIERVRDALDKLADNLPEQPRDIIADTFRIEGCLHRGQDCELLDLVHRDTGERFVLKTLRPETGSDQGLRDRLTREGQIAARISSDRFAIARLQLRLRDGRPALLIPWAGRALTAELSASQPSASVVRQWIEDLLESLAELHAHEIVHCDLSPANLLVGEDGRLRICDFGLWLATGECHADLGLAKAGTAQFRAPEQQASTPAHPALDIYAAGKIIEHMERVTGTGDPYLHSLSSKMTREEPAQRPNARQALQILRAAHVAPPSPAD